MKQSLQLRLGQQLTMTPQLQQAIRLLQLSSMELQTEIQETLEANPMLEVDEGDNNNDTASETQVTARSSDDNDTDGGTSTVERGTGDDEADFSSAWSLRGYGVAGDGDDDYDPLARYAQTSDSLHDHLLEQLHMSALSEHERIIGTTLIDAIGDDGYLRDDLTSIGSGLERQGLDVTPEEVETVLHHIQSFEPLGVGARQPRECLLLQLRALPDDTPGLATARRIVSQAVDSLAAHDYRGLKRQFRLDDSELETAVGLIQSLDPHPGSQFSESTAGYIAPDVFVRKDNGIWRVRLNPDIEPRLRINPTYSGMVRRADSSADNAFLRDHLQEARWFIKSIESRNETLMRVATAIVEHQRAFLEYGEEAMKPLVLRDIAEYLEMHESTISRVTTEKYMDTPRGLLEFKYFFSSHVGTVTGGECSATAIRAMVRKLIADEQGRKPLSDHRIADLLRDQGIHVARRTVAKYREAMAIPPSNERKRLR